jgi:hypothetical protein
MNIASKEPKIITIYKSMDRIEKGKMRKSYCHEFGCEIQKFDRRIKNKHVELVPAEKKWASDFTGIPIEELFPTCIV